jgi:hypothetical protein
MSDQEDGPEPGTAGRRPYTAPGIQWEEVYEVKANLASACDKIGTSDPLCATAPAS